MPRSEARIRTSTWRNHDFTELTRAQQATYWMVLSQPDMSQAGVAPYMPGRWSRLSADDGDDLDDDLEVLHARRYVLIDDTTSEIWVRSFCKHDGILRSHKTRIGMWAAYSAILSPRIRAAFLNELDQDHIDEAISEAWITSEELENGVSDDPWGGSGIPHPDPPDTPPDTPSDTQGDAPGDRGSLARAASAPASASTTASPRARTRESDPAATEPPADVGGGEKPPDPKQRAERALQRIRSGMPAILAGKLDQQHAQAVDALTPLALAGWQPRELADAISQRPWDGVHDPARTLKRRAADLDGAEPPSLRARRAREPPAGCPNEHQHGQLVDDDGQPEPCPCGWTPDTQEAS